MHTVLEAIGQAGIVPVVVINDAAKASDLCHALHEGGLPIAEITFRTAAAADAIRNVCSDLPDVLVGAGTVLSVEQAQKALDCGAKFIVNPGFNPKIVSFCQQNNVPVTPGCATPTDMMMAVDMGLEVVKFFPAESIGGLKALKAIAAPFTMLKFVPTGGIEPGNLRDYLGFPKVHAVGGSWMVKADLIDNGNFARITDLTRNAVALLRESRPLSF